MSKHNTKAFPQARLNSKTELARAQKKIKAFERQAQIEAALERVRARAMAMYRSEELAETASVMFREFRKLTNIAIGTGTGCWISIIDTENEIAENWGTDFEGVTLSMRFRLPQMEHPVLAKNFAAYKRGEPLIVTDLSRQAFIDFTQYISRLPDFATDPVIREAIANPPKRYLQYEASFSKGVIGIGAVHPLQKKDTDLLQHFAKVFEQTYTRFLDLKKAEEQAREAQIEAALERVRARTMAMHQSDELAGAAAVVFEQLRRLGLKVFWCYFNLMDEATASSDIWITTPGGDENPTNFRIPFASNPHVEKGYTLWKQGVPYFSKVWEGEEAWTWLAYLHKQYGWANYREVLPMDNLAKELGSIPERFMNTEACFAYGTLGVTTFDSLDEASLRMLQRFAKVFEITYRRFLDLKQAEAQAREAQIEAALERVRASTMAMHKSDELRSVIATVFEQLKGLGFEAPACGLIIFEENGDAVNWLSGFGEEIFPVGYHIPHFDHPYYQAWLEAWKAGEPWRDFVVEGDLKRSFDGHLFQHSDFKNLPDEIKGEFGKIDRAVSSNAFMTHGMLGILALEPIADEQKNIIKRFAKVFDQTYTRFLDLKKAEERAREAEIEAALERVRARTMAMHRSDELAEVAVAVFQQLRGLGITPDRTLIPIVDEQTATAVAWMTTQGGEQVTHGVKVTLTGHPVLEEVFERWKRKDRFIIQDLSGAALAGFLEWIQKVSDTPYSEIPERRVYGYASFSYGMVAIVQPEPIPPETKDILIRFARVFEQTYTRFLDLQKAEAQAREAQIEAALERVRARTMGMHKSEELGEVAVLLYKELRSLGLTQFFNCGYVEVDEANEIQYAWTTKPDGSLLEGHTLPLIGDPVLNPRYENWKRKDAIFSQEVGGDRLRRHIEFVSPHLGSAEAEEVARTQFPDPAIFYCGNFSKGYLHIISGTPLSTEEGSLLSRFTRVFEMTYSRFLDLKKAEAQAREAQIEAALERVRARTMAMHNSEELKAVVSVLYKQLDSLGLADWGCSIMIFDKDLNRIENWVAESTGSDLLNCYYVEGQKHPVFKKLWKFWEQQGPPMTLHHTDEVKRDFDNYWLNETDFKALPEEVKLSVLNEREIFLSYASMRHGLLSAAGYERLPDEKIAILERFSKVFEQTYTRFLDLKKAEAQAREAQIEAALERVRTRAMAMHKSADLNMAVATVFEELEKLDLGTLRCGIGILDKKRRCADVFTTSKSEHGSAVQVAGDESMDIHPLLQGAFDAWLKQGDFSYVLEGEDLAGYYRALGETNFRLPESQSMVERAERLRQYYYVATFEAGGLFAFRETAFPEEAKAVMKRFAGVFNLTYKRFLDIQQAEARAREAEQQASLDRVRAEIASMRTADDLQRITPLIWRELTTLGVPFLRCGVFIIEEATERAHVYLSTPSGEAVAALHLQFDSAPVLKAAAQHWGQQQVYGEEWNREQFIAWTQSLLEQRQIDSPQKYQAGEEAPEKLVLQFVPFTQGMLYIGSSAALSDDEIAIGQALAKAFGVAYARYEDFQRLETAKAQIEAALDNLKKTQGQLVQAEKMASLGQLTAGIAHEIKNPLNFVNNFAALSVDLAKELREELIKRKTKNVNGDEFTDVEEILDMLEQNAEKINHHGKRADGIVHAMMQHARGGKGERQPTDVNKLVEDYVNLAYHGMRAKVPDFNVTIEQDFGELDGKIEMVPQDIGRVLLNLLSNAFDAVHEKKQSGDGTYSPSVSISTRAVGGAVEIRVRDNGGGILDEVREKIFEPFFTTKPAGSGTGLGLSLSFDIVTQGHGGTLTVESKQGEGATFVVMLPANKVSNTAQKSNT